MNEIKEMKVSNIQKKRDHIDIDETKCTVICYAALPAHDGHCFDLQNSKSL